jgi:hypothetical protein
MVGGHHWKWFHYYWNFCRSVGAETYKTWRWELFSSVVVVVFTFVLGGDWKDFRTAIGATALTLGCFIAWHVARAPWLLHKSTHQSEEGDLPNKWFGFLGLAAIVALVVSGICLCNTLWAARPLGTITVEIKSPSPPQITRVEPAAPERKPELRVEDKDGPLNGRVIYMGQQSDLNFPDPLWVRNVGNGSTQAISIRVSFSEVVDLTVRAGGWQSTGTGSDEFPFELWIGGPITIDPQERYWLPTLQGKRAVQSDRAIIVKIKAFCGTEEPTQAIFRLEKPKPQSQVSP